MTPDSLADRARRNLAAWLPPAEFEAHFPVLEAGSPTERLLRAYRLAWQAYHDSLLGDPTDPVHAALVLELDRHASRLCWELCSLVVTVGRRGIARRRRPVLQLMDGGRAA